MPESNPNLIPTFMSWVANIPSEYWLLTRIEPIAKGFDIIDHDWSSPISQLVEMVRRRLDANNCDLLTASFAYSLSQESISKSWFHFICTNGAVWEIKALDDEIYHTKYMKEVHLDGRD